MQKQYSLKKFTYHKIDQIFRSSELLHVEETPVFNLIPNKLFYIVKTNIHLTETERPQKQSKPKEFGSRLELDKRDVIHQLIVYESWTWDTSN